MEENVKRPTFTRADLENLWPVWGSEEEEALKRVLNSGIWCRVKESRWDHGEVAKLEQEFANFINAEHFLAVTNGTVAIELALKALGVKPGDEVLVPASTFHATVTPVLSLGAIPVFVDSNENDFLIDVKNLEMRITPRTRAVVVVHLSGLPVDMDSLLKICQQHSLPIVEDCAQAVGTKYRHRHVGTIGDIGCFSFQQDKALNCGEGGGVATQSSTLAGKLYALHNGFSMPGALLPGQKFETVVEADSSGGIASKDS